MSKLSKFLGASKEVEIRGEKLKMFPLAVKDMVIIDRIDTLSKKETEGTITSDERLELPTLGSKLIQSAFKEEGITDEEIEQMDVDLYAELYAAVMENMFTQRDGKGLSRIRELKEKASRQEQPK